MSEKYPSSPFIAAPIGAAWFLFSWGLFYLIKWIVIGFKRETNTGSSDGVDLKNQRRAGIKMAKQPKTKRNLVAEINGLSEEINKILTSKMTDRYFEGIALLHSLD